MLTLYGINNCDTVRKAKKWLNSHQIEFQFHDFRKDGLEQKQVETWVNKLGWEVVLNKRGTTWRQLSSNETDQLNNSKAVSLLLKHPTLIKRPVLEGTGILSVGFTESRYRQLLLK